MPNDTELQHYGKKGMKWGVRTSSGSTGGGSAGGSKGKVGGPEAPDKDIRAAREGLPKAREGLKQAKLDYKVKKAEYKTNKKEIGRAAAKAVLYRDGKTKLNDAKDKYNKQWALANKDTTEEYINKFVKSLFETRLNNI